MRNQPTVGVRCLSTGTESYKAASKFTIAMISRSQHSYVRFPGVR
jgi:hypothetical protein